jgi:hypothetical protein
VGPFKRRNCHRWSAAPYVASHTSQELKMDKPAVLITGAVTVDGGKTAG